MRVKNKLLLSWILLLVAIIFEVVATSFLKIFEGEILGYALMAVFIVLSYYCMALAIRHIKVGIAYCLWEVLGSIFIICISFFIFNEILNIKQILGIILAIAGILLINISEYKQ